MLRVCIDEKTGNQEGGHHRPVGRVPRDEARRTPPAPSAPRDPEGGRLRCPRFWRFRAF